MKSKRNKKDVVSQNFKEFCKHSTLHGFYYFYKSSSFWVQTLWCVIIGSSAGLCGYLSHMIWEKYAVNPTFTIVETTQYATERIPFPAITICDPEVIYEPSSKNITVILSRRGFNKSMINEFYKSFRSVKKTDYIPNDQIKKMHLLLADLGYSYNFLLLELRKPCSVLLNQCFWRSKSFDCSAMFKEVLTIHGYCCQFDILYFRKHASKDTNFVGGIEISEALDVVVDTKISLTNDKSNNGYVFLYVFDSLNHLSLFDGSITLSSGMFFDVTVDVSSIDSSSDVKALAVDTRQCFLESLFNLVSMTFLPACGIDYFASTNIWKKLKQASYKMSSPHTSATRSVTSFSMKQKRDCLRSEHEEGLCRVAVHFADNTCIKYRREVLYTWDQMLANLGGIFGLCLGGSIISIIEFLLFLIELSYKILKKTKKTHPKNENKTIFTLNQRNFAQLSKKHKKIDFPFIH